MSRVSKTCLLVLIVVGLLAVLQLWPTVNVVQGSGGGAVFWNSNEAFVFLGENLYGPHMDAPRYALEPFLVALGRVHPTEATICSRMLVIRITNTEIKTYDTNIDRDPDDKGCKFSAQVFRGQIYAIGWPAMWRWNGGRPHRLGNSFTIDGTQVSSVRPSVLEVRAGGLRVPRVYLDWANPAFLSFVPFNRINNLRVFTVGFSSIPTAPTNLFCSRLYNKPLQPS
jgi:hypothetical protein